MNINKLVSNGTGMIIERKKWKYIGEVCKEKGDKSTKVKNGRKRGRRACDIKLIFPS